MILNQIPIEDVRSYWNRKIMDWEKKRYSLARIIDPASWPLRARLRRAMALLQEVSGQGERVLELGCGSGKLAELLAKNHEGVRYTGVDISDEAVLAAQARKLGDRFRFSREGALVAVEESGSFDSLVFLGLTDWLNPEDLRELLGKAKSKHVIFSFTEKSGGFFSRLYSLYRSKTDTQIPKYGGLAYSREEIRDCLSSAGYLVRRMERQDPFSPGRLVLGAKERK
jgi:SAM-dependent methyltransferase